MDSHEIVGSVMLGEKDPVSVKIGVDIESDNLPDDPRVYLNFDADGSHTIVAFPLKELFRAIEKALIN